MRVYFDICAIQRPHSQTRVRLEAEAILTLIELCESGRLELVVSAAHEIENGQNPYPERHAYATDVLALAHHRVPSRDEVARRAAAYAEAGLARLDALHLAAAVSGGAAFFCTADDRLLRRGRALDTNETAVVSPLDLILQLDLL